MDALELLQQRNSASKLTDPAPDQAALEQMLQAALRAPDHARLRPWRFLTIAGDDRHRLGELFVLAEQQRRSDQGLAALNEAEQGKLAAKALRAPLIIVVVTRLQSHPKVPEVEQRLSAGCAAHALLLAAETQGFAGIWRTGSNAFDPLVMRGLGLAEREEIAGFLYFGTVDGQKKALAKLDPADYCQAWPAS